MKMASTPREQRRAWWTVGGVIAAAALGVIAGYSAKVPTLPVQTYQPTTQAPTYQPTSQAPADELELGSLFDRRGFFEQDPELQKFRENIRLQKFREDIRKLAAGETLDTPDTEDPTPTNRGWLYRDDSNIKVLGGPHVISWADPDEQQHAAIRIDCGPSVDPRDIPNVSIGFNYFYPPTEYLRSFTQRVRWGSGRPTTQTFGVTLWPTLKVSNDTAFIAKLAANDAFAIEVMSYDGFSKNVLRWSLNGTAAAINKLPCIGPPASGRSPS